MNHLNGNKPHSSVSNVPMEPAALAGNYLRNFTNSLSQFSEFSAFLESLRQLVGNDTYLNGSAAMCDPFANKELLPDFEDLAPSESVVPLAGPGGNAGYIKYTGRRDGNFLGASDLHLLGSISGFISSLVWHAQNYRKKAQAAALLEYLVNQLPLGVVCLDAQNEVMLDNQIAKSLLAEDGLEQIKDCLVDSADTFASGTIRIQLELPGRLIFCEGRRLSLDPENEFTVFVLSDLTVDRHALTSALEREAYRAEARGSSLVITLVESADEPGLARSLMESMRAELKLLPENIHTLDAYRSLCIFNQSQLFAVRFLMRTQLARLSSSISRMAFVKYSSVSETTEPAALLIQSALERLEAPNLACLPTMWVMDNYKPVVDSMKLVLSNHYHVVTGESMEALEAAVRDGTVDGLMLDIDACTPADLARFNMLTAHVSLNLKIVYLTYKSPEVVRHDMSLEASASILQKPFEAPTVFEILGIPFNA